MNLSEITPLILTRDEEANIERTLGQLTWATEVLVVDSYSTDRTIEIARTFPNVRILQRSFDTLAGQSNFGLNEARTPWVLLLDADYFVPAPFVRELEELTTSPGINAYRGSFRYAVNGRALRASLYPPRVVLLRRNQTSVWQDGHAHRVLVDGETGDLQTPLVHDDRKSFSRFVARQRVYMRQEAQKLRDATPRSLPLAHRVRRLIVVAPFAVVIHSLFVRGLLLDGRAGLHYAGERFIAELILARELLRRR
jgi:glycosyltransferase involved in cell wall biosynthesis